MLTASCVVLLLFLSVLCVSCENVSSFKSEQEPALFIVSFDGFRPDYLYRNVTPNLNKVRREGTSARYMLPVFPTKTLVNHFTMATGLYPGNHGVLGNTVYDSDIGNLKYGYDLFHYNESTLPIWTANQLAGKHSGCWWPGGDFAYNGVSCTFGNSFNKSVPLENRIDTIMNWFTDEKTPINLAMLYVEEPDGQSHMYGPDSINTIKAAARVDDLTGYIENKLIENKLQDRVNVIYLSDHGMAGIPPSQFIDLTQFVGNNTCDFYGTTPVLQVVPRDGTIESEVYANLTKAAEKNGHFKIYNQHNLPARWHAYNQRRSGPILAVADIGYGFQDMLEQAIMYERDFGVPYNNDSMYGMHGYDNEELLMRAFFTAKGPLFAKGKRIRAIQMIDLYNLFCRILQIETFCGDSDGSKDPIIWNKLFATGRHF